MTSQHLHERLVARAVSGRYNAFLGVGGGLALLGLILSYRSLTPETFQIVLSLENEFGGGAFLGMGLSSDTRQGGFDVDFVAYKEGVIIPTLPPMGLAGDYNDDGTVDAADYTVWRDNLGGAFAMPNETVTPGSVTIEDYDEWKANFGSTAGSGAALAAAGVPEPATLVAAIVASFISIMLTRHRRSGMPFVRANMPPVV